ncbi:unnamed protein product [Allacma fusca]|uniref:Uncharacterized protein n=1 Tax=Allacma fusca TaxID=39272 RepID=A0A8J2KPV6_9HEXA|nr:unnamed protein product [Allacma fusca]
MKGSITTQKLYMVFQNRRILSVSILFALFAAFPKALQIIVWSLLEIFCRVCINVIRLRGRKQKGTGIPPWRESLG